MRIEEKNKETEITVQEEVEIKQEDGSIVILEQGDTFVVLEPKEVKSEEGEL
jgi:uncharacterized cupin superfamily protein